MLQGTRDVNHDPRNSFGCWSFRVRRATVCAGLLLLFSGCSTPSLTTRPPTVRFIGTETAKELETATFLECSSPESRELFERKLQRSDMSRPFYFTDKANRDQPTLLDVPVTYTLTWECYQRLQEQGGEVRPELELQMRQRKKVLIAKVYETSTAVHDAKDRLVRTDVERETYPRFYDWLWHPECKVVKKRPVRFEVHNLGEQAGVVTEGHGMMDDFGRIVFDLRPYMHVGVGSVGGLQFTFLCPSDGLTVDVIVAQDVFLAFQ